MSSGADRRLAALRSAAAEAVAGSDAFRVDPVERARRARDYRTWALMREAPQRVRDLASQLLGPDGTDSQTFEETCVALTGLLAELYEHGGRPGGGQSGQ